MSPCLEVSGLTVGYGRVPVVHDIALTIEPGEIVALLGANGAGKSTILLALAGELRPVCGTVRMDGRDLRGALHRRARNGIAFVGEERSLFTKLSVLDNLRLGRGPVGAVVEVFPELAPLLGRRAGLLSGGEQQMVAVGRALASSPRLLLIDELSLGLAPLVVDRLLGALRAAAERGTSVLLVEQHARKALVVASRASVVRRGRVVLQGSAAELTDRFHEVERAYLHDGGDVRREDRLITSGGRA